MDSATSAVDSQVGQFRPTGDSGGDRQDGTSLRNIEAQCVELPVRCGKIADEGHWRKRLRTKPEVFIVESLDFKDEEAERFEGKILTEILRMCGKTPLYYYIRTKRELREVLKFFAASNYRYLHLSCHGNRESIWTTLDEVSFNTLGGLLRPCGSGRRLFVSACESVNNDLADAVMPESGLISIGGPCENVTFDEAAVLWASFYQLMFREGPEGMRGRDVRYVLEHLANLFEVPLAYYAKTTSSGRHRRTVFEVQ